MLAARSRTCLAVLCATAALLCSRPAPAQHVDEYIERAANYEEALARHAVLMKRKPLRHHFIARELLAYTRKPEAFAILVEDWKKVKEYRDPSRYHLSTLFGSHFDTVEAAEVLRPLRLANPKPADIWLWVQALRVETKCLGAADTLQIVRTDRSVHHQAAAVVALSLRGVDEMWDAIYHMATNFPSKESDRCLVLGAMSGTVLKNKSKVRSERARAGMTAYISLLADAVKLDHTSKVQMARHLQIALNGPGLLIQPEPWLLLLSQDAPKKPSGGGDTVTAPRFFGIETEGERFCYVVDMSDSMLQEISPSVKPKGPVTGPKKKPKGEILNENDLPWHAINTRFDLAREHLKLSLLRLSEDKYFSIVWFGDSSGTLPSCPGLIKATKSNVAKVCKDLDAIVPGPAQPGGSPLGSLRGDTNLHSGIRRAFALSGKGFVETDAFIDAGPLTEGCDTIFLLSDGKPSIDDYHCMDKDYGEGEAISDYETNAPAARAPIMGYAGPYIHNYTIASDVERMNTFRRVRIHGIGIGEADENLLRRLADIGNGQVYMVGKEQKQEAARKPQ
ncbi:MAG: hypothetical protein ABL997_15370 [Planctomycetota bacterium]